MISNSFRILVIDDSQPFRRQVGGALEASGLAVCEASEGIEALWRARAGAVFDLVLVDIHMPRLDGLSFIRDVRKLPGYAEIPIVVVTSDGSRERRQEGHRAGATAWLLKPCDLPGLVHAVHAALLRTTKLKPANTLRPETPQLSPLSKKPSPRSKSPLSREPASGAGESARLRRPDVGTEEARYARNPNPLPEQPLRLQRPVQFAPAPPSRRDPPDPESSSKPPGSR